MAHDEMMGLEDLGMHDTARKLRRLAWVPPGTRNVRGWADQLDRELSMLERQVARRAVREDSDEQMRTAQQFHPDLAVGIAELAQRRARVRAELRACRARLRDETDYRSITTRLRSALDLLDTTERLAAALWRELLLGRLAGPQGDARHS